MNGAQNKITTIAVISSIRHSRVRRTCVADISGTTPP